MLRPLPQTRDFSLAYRLAAVVVFTLLTAVSARITIPVEPVPITLQVLIVVLSGLVLGARDGVIFLAQLEVGLRLLTEVAHGDGDGHVRGCAIVQVAPR